MCDACKKYLCDATMSARSRLRAPVAGVGLLGLFHGCLQVDGRVSRQGLERLFPDQICFKRTSQHCIAANPQQSTV